MAKVEVFSDRESWLAARRKGIGASEAAAILGLSRFQTPLDVYLQKVGLAPETVQNEAMEWGLRLQKVIVDKYREETGRVVIEPWPFTITWGDPPFFATLDAEVKTLERDGVLEAKNVSAYRADEWEESAPLEYDIQLQHQLEATGKEWGSLAALLGGNKFRWLDRERHDKFLVILRERVKEFWRRVELKDPPPAQEGDKEALTLLYPQETGETIALPGEALQIDCRLSEIKSNFTALESEEKLLKNRLKEMIGPATWGAMPDGSGRWQWKLEHKDGYQVKEQDNRVLRRLKK